MRAATSVTTPRFLSRVRAMRSLVNAACAALVLALVGVVSCARDRFPPDDTSENTSDAGASTATASSTHAAAGSTTHTSTTTTTSAQSGAGGAGGHSGAGGK